jgi:hypothetical protein
MFRILWSKKILEETINSIARRRPEIQQARLIRRVDLMNLAIQDAEVSGYEGLLPSLEPLGSDAHVLAAAIIGRADVIVTFNTADFPDAILEPYKIAVQVPDAFLQDQWGLRPDIVEDALREQARQLKHPPQTPKEILLKLQRLAPGFSDALLSSGLNWN